MPTTSSKFRASSKLLRPTAQPRSSARAFFFRGNAPQRFGDAAHGKAAGRARLGHQGANLLSRAVMKQEIFAPPPNPIHRNPWTWSSLRCVIDLGFRINHGRDFHLIEHAPDHGGHHQQNNKINDLRHPLGHPLLRQLPAAGGFGLQILESPPPAHRRSRPVSIKSIQSRGNCLHRCTSFERSVPCRMASLALLREPFAADISGGPPCVRDRAQTTKLPR